MLNKGPYIPQAIGLLDELLTKLESFQSKNVAMSPTLDSL
jgi:hypothetical protein